MTYAHFVQDFEGWFKGDPEFEIHILGQSGASDSLTDYQCAGEPAGGYYRFDQNSLDWSGRVLLFSQAQLNSYKTAHPNQNFRIIALEDDDTGCGIKFDSNRFKNLQNALQSQYPNLTGSKDTTSSTLGRIIKRANALQKILSAAYSFITTQDDLIGNAIEDVVVGQVLPRRQLDREGREQRDQRLDQTGDALIHADLLPVARTDAGLDRVAGLVHPGPQPVGSGRGGWVRPFLGRLHSEHRGTPIVPALPAHDVRTRLGATGRQVRGGSPAQVRVGRTCPRGRPCRSGRERSLQGVQRGTGNGLPDRHARNGQPAGAARGSTVRGLERRG